jgi:hypothetical protein
MSVEGRLLTVRRGVNERFYGMQVCAIMATNHNVCDYAMSLCMLQCDVIGDVITPSMLRRISAVPPQLGTGTSIHAINTAP